MKKLLKWIAIIFIGLVVLGLIIGGGEETTEQTGSNAVMTDKSSDSNATPTEVEVEAEAEADSLTRPQANAVRSAKQYISMTGFSRDGLIQQLSSSAGNGYDVDDATIAVDSLNIDWNEQAVRSAQQYLDMTGFSCDGLIQQLSSSAGSKYTVSEATYGAKQAGACS